MIGGKTFEESNLRIGYIICFVTAIGFICSLTYNYGYFWFFEAGIRMLSIGDILTSYSLWVPGLTTLFFWYCLDLFVQRIEAEEEHSRSKARRKLVKSLMGWPQNILFVIVLILIGFYLTFGYPYKPLALWVGCFLIWLKISGHLMAARIFAGRVNKFILGIFLFIPVVLSMMFALGLDKAIDDSKLHNANAIFYFLFEKQQHPAILLRHLEKGLLAKEVNDNNYILFTWDDISKIEIISHERHFNGVLCDWFNVQCAQKKLKYN